MFISSGSQSVCHFQMSHLSLSSLIQGNIACCRSHYNSVVLRRAFEGWRDEWWTSRREWGLTMRAECHYRCRVQSCTSVGRSQTAVVSANEDILCFRYYLYHMAFHSWRTFMSLQRDKKSKVQNAQSFGMILYLTLCFLRWHKHLICH